MGLPDLLWNTVATKDTRLLGFELSGVFSSGLSDGHVNTLCCREGISWDLDYVFLRGIGSSEEPHREFLNGYFSGKLPGSPARGILAVSEDGETRLVSTTASLCGIEAAMYSGDSAMLEWAVRLHIMLHAFIFTLKGEPLVTESDEYALTYPESIKGQKPARVTGSVSNEVFTAIEQLREIRASRRAFSESSGIGLLDLKDRGMLAIWRYFEGDKLIAVFNFSETEKTADFGKEFGAFRDLMTGEKIKKESVTVPSGGFVWMADDFREEITE